MRTGALDTLGVAARPQVAVLQISRGYNAGAHVCWHVCHNCAAASLVSNPLHSARQPIGFKPRQEPTEDLHLACHSVADHVL